MEIAQGNHNLFISGELFSEFLEVMARPKFALPLEKQKEFANDLLEIAQPVETHVKVNVVKEDPDDDAVLECELSAKADFIISGDKHLLRLGQFEGIRILSAGDFLKLTR